MKKVFLMIGVAMAFTACESEPSDSENQIVNVDNSQNYQTNTYTGSGTYLSPWDFIKVDYPIVYHFESTVVNQDPSSRLFVRVTPYIGLAYSDGIDDGIYDPYSPWPSINLASGSYPNLYANGKEYGNYIQASPIILADPSLTGGWYTHELYINTLDHYHCPVLPVQPHFNMNVLGVYFDIENNNFIQPSSIFAGQTISPAPPSATFAEIDLLKNYGKVMYYKIEYGNNPYNFFPEKYYILSLEADVSQDLTEWDKITDISSVNQVKDEFNMPLYYHNSPQGKEIIVDAKDFIGHTPNYIGSNVNFSGPKGSRKVTTQGGNGYVSIRFY